MQFEVKGDGRLALKLKQEENSGNIYAFYFNNNNNQKFRIEKGGDNKAEVTVADAHRISSSDFKSYVIR